MKLRKTIVILLALLLAGMAMVPCVSAAEKISERLPGQWEKDHTVQVTHETTYLYSEGTLKVTDIYSGDEFQKKFGVPDFKRVRTYKIDQDNAKAKNLKEGFKETRREVSSEVFTTERDPPEMILTYDYPQWIYAKDGNNYLQLDEPINIAWESTSLNSVKQEITEEGWTDSPLEDTYYVYDSVNGWMADDGLANDAVRLFGGYHIRLWSMSDGDIVGAAHEDSSAIPFGHHAIGFENIEEMVAEFYDEADDTNWHVYQDDYALNNYVADPYSNGMATRVFWS